VARELAAVLGLLTDAAVALARIALELLDLLTAGKDLVADAAQTVARKLDADLPGQLGRFQFFTNGINCNLCLELCCVAFPLRHRGRSFVSRHSLATGPKSCDHLATAPKIALQRRERGGLAATRRFASLAHIDYVEIDEIAEGGQAGNGRVVRRQALIDPGLRSGRAQRWASSRRGNVSRSKAALSSDLNPVGTGGKLGDGGHFRVRCVCNESS
jgi:hypothetical protein